MERKIKNKIDVTKNKDTENHANSEINNDTILHMERNMDNKSNLEENNVKYMECEAAINSDKDYHKNTKFKQFLDLIKKDNVVEFKLLLDTLSPEQRRMVLEGNTPAVLTTDFSQKLKGKYITLVDNIHNIFHLSVIYGAHNICKYLVDEECNVFCTEGCDWNVLHILAVVTYYKREFEPEAVKIYKFLLDVLSANQIEVLLKMEDEEELRPLELALHSGTCCKIKYMILSILDYFAKIYISHMITIDTPCLELLKVKHGGFVDCYISILHLYKLVWSVQSYVMAKRHLYIYTCIRYIRRVQSIMTPFLAKFATWAAWMIAYLYKLLYIEYNIIFNFFRLYSTVRCHV